MDFRIIENLFFIHAQFLFSASITLNEPIESRRLWALYRAHSLLDSMGM